MNAATTALLASVTIAPPALPLASSAQDAAAGERLFRTRCASCHSIEPGQNRIGPSLGGIMGRKAGSVEGARTSPAMREIGITWDTTQLERFLANPRAVVKGTTMTIAVARADDRAAIAAYLQQTTNTN